VSLVVRPERITLEPGEPDATGPAGATNRLRGRITRTTFRGAQTQVAITLAGVSLVADVANVHGEVPDWLHDGREVWACISPRAIRVLPRPTSGEVADHAPAGG
jgi:ABC-type Fe3+/spermidine/putrescine transport system ATPase subunit